MSISLPGIQPANDYVPALAKSLAIEVHIKAEMLECNGWPIPYQKLTAQGAALILYYLVIDDSPERKKCLEVITRDP
ncbi:hypothetical protein ANO14919_011690 [Xylariales sp. No.14919]|nr:hypothetical protein ANO14919_011690 [Xylariales sp. No.14919]